MGTRDRHGEVDPELDDPQLADEIALLGEVVAEVAAIGHALSEDEVDRVLGVHPPREGAGQVASGDE